MKLCRNCDEWYTTSPWMGNCRKHPWEKDRYSQDASAYGCPDYVDKSEKYKFLAEDFRSAMAYRELGEE